VRILFLLTAHFTGLAGNPNQGTGPAYDHTTGETGYFVSANPNEASSGDKARLVSGLYFSGQVASCEFPFEYEVSIELPPLVRKFLAFAIRQILCFYLDAGNTKSCCLHSENHVASL